MPTFNGARYIRRALDALQAQDYRNLRILISDNASTDGTRDICRAAAESDGRITYRRQPKNVGATRNFNQVFELTDGPYFMWAADDDRWHPTYVRRCVEALEAERHAVMATTGLRFIDEDDGLLDRDYAIYDNPDLSSPDVTARVAALVRRGGWYQVYGLARRDALARTGLLRDVYGADVVLTLELALLGPILRVPDILFWFRQHTARTEIDRASRQGRITDADRVLRAKYTFLEESLVEVVRTAPLPRLTRAEIVADILRAAYFDDTPLSRHTRNEVGIRTRQAAAEADVPGFAKFASIRGVKAARRVAHRLRRSAVRRRR